MKHPVLVPSVLVLGIGVAVAGTPALATAAPVPPARVATANMQLGNPSGAVTLAEDGSSLLFPHLQTIAPGFHKAYPNVTLNPAAGGSGKGITDATSGVTQMGGSDAYLPPTDFHKYPTVENIPIAVSSQSVDYNLPGIKHLKLTGNVVAQIYQGKITKWNDAAIQKLNKGVKLPGRTIVPIVRSDSSGDTFIFTSFLTATNRQWKAGPGFNTTVTWPTVAGELTANGNPGMVESASKTPDSIAYIGISAQGDADRAKLGQARLRNASGSFVLPDKATVSAAVAASKSKIPNDLAASLIYSKGKKSYPIVNLEYLVVKPPEPSAAVAQGIRDFLAYATNPRQGSSPANLAAQGFVALPSSVIGKVDTAISKIH